MQVSHSKKTINRRHFEKFSELFQTTRFDISCKLSPWMKCQTPFSEKSSNCCLLNLPERGKVKLEPFINLILIWSKRYTKPLMPITSEAS